MCKGMGSWWRDKYIYRSKTVPMPTKCRRVHSHVYSTALNSSINLPSSGVMIHKVRAWGSEDTTSQLQASHEAGRNMGGLQNKNSNFFTKKFQEDGSTAADRKIADKIWTTMTWAVYEGDVSIMLALRAVLGWRTTAWWRSRASWGMAWDPFYMQRWKHKVGFHNRGVQLDTPVARWAGEENGWIKLMAQRKPRKTIVIRSLFESLKEAVEKKAEPNTRGWEEADPGDQKRLHKTGSMDTPSSKRENVQCVQWQRLRIFCETGGAEGPLKTTYCRMGHTHLS